MRIQDAVWEKRNLGVSCQEVAVEDNDSPAEVCDGIDTLNADYQVVKIPAGRADVSMLLQERGFRFSETAIRVEHEVNHIDYPSPILERLTKCVGFQQITELSRVSENIEQEMFVTDRIALDPHFSRELAAKRYVGWMHDELRLGSSFFEYTYKGKAVGFVCMRQGKELSFYSVLGGVYPSDHMFPLGCVLLYKQLEIARSLGGAHLYTYISGNNIAGVKAYSQCGYFFSEIKYVFVRHTAQLD